MSWKPGDTLATGDDCEASDGRGREDRTRRRANAGLPRIRGSGWRGGRQLPRRTAVRPGRRAVRKGRARAGPADRVTGSPGPGRIEPSARARDRRLGPRRAGVARQARRRPRRGVGMVDGRSVRPRLRGAASRTGVDDGGHRRLPAAGRRRQLRRAERDGPPVHPARPASSACRCHDIPDAGGDRPPCTRGLGAPDPARSGARRGVRGRGVAGPGDRGGRGARARRRRRPR